MINLLPNQAITKIRSLYLKRVASLSLLLLILVLGSSIVFLVPSYIAALDHLSQVEQSLAAARARPVSKQAESLALKAKEVNQRIKIVSEGALVSVGPSMRTIVDGVLKYHMDGTKFSRIEFADGSVVLRGQASTRSAFLALVDGLKGDSQFSDVSSPISSLIATSSLDFSIQMRVVPQK